MLRVSFFICKSWKMRLFQLKIGFSIDSEIYLCWGDFDRVNKQFQDEKAKKWNEKCRCISLVIIIEFIVRFSWWYHSYIQRIEQQLIFHDEHCTTSLCERNTRIFSNWKPQKFDTFHSKLFLLISIIKHHIFGIEMSKSLRKVSLNAPKYLGTKKKYVKCIRNFNGKKFFCTTTKKNKLFDSETKVIISLIAFGWEFDTINDLRLDKKKCYAQKLKAFYRVRLHSVSKFGTFVGLARSESVIFTFLAKIMNLFLDT